MRSVLVPVLTLAALACMPTLVACDELNRPMPVTTGGSSASSAGAPRSPADAGSDAGMPPMPGDDQPKVAPQPGDVQL